MDISKTILSDPINKWVFSNAKTGAFLVGGYVRDLLRCHISKDKDFILKNAVENLAVATAKKFNGTLIALKPGQTYRVVLKDKVGTTRFREILDFSSLNSSINNDLKERDFTINAIAWSPETGIIDLFKGSKDIKNHIIKAVRIKNLTDDPIRVIRAYRIAAELSFRIKDNTRKYLKLYAKNLAMVASERITEELFKILSTDNAIIYLKECYRDKVLEKILIPRGIKNANSLSENIRYLRNFDLFLKTQRVKINKSLERKKITAHFNEEISQGLNRLGLIRLALILRDGSISHSRLRISNNINKALRDIHNGYKVVTTCRNRLVPSSRAVKKLSTEELYKIFNAAGNRVPEIALILSFIKRKSIKGLLKQADEFLKIKNKILLNGNDVQKILNIQPGITVGKILLALKEQQLKGLVKTRAEAKKWLVLNFT